MPPEDATEGDLMKSMIRSFIDLERSIDRVIAHYFAQPEKRQFLIETFLGENSPFGRKLDSLKKINNKENYLDNQEWKYIKRCQHIRNRISHYLPNEEDEYSISINGTPREEDLQSCYELYKEAWEEVKPKLEGIVHDFENQEKRKRILNNPAFAEVHLRNYKQYHTDIYDLILRDKDTRKVSINYPNNIYSTDLTEEAKEIIREDIRKFLASEYDIHEEIDIEIMLDEYIEP